ncbi:major capsid protein [Gordonia phage BeeGee]|nr:major capsid protein [Gordonia phage BeeGee]
MALWTDVIDPATLTGYVRQSMADYEASKGSLSVFLPNRTVPDIVARFTAGQSGLLDAAEYRSYDAEASIGGPPEAKRVTLELPPLGRKVRVSEYDQLRMRGTDQDELVLNSILNTAAIVGRAISDRAEVARGAVINSGKAAINENGFIAEADFGRDASLTVTAPTLWSVSASASPLTNLRLWADAMSDLNGDRPGAALMSTRVYNAMTTCAEFRALAATTAGTPNIVTREYVQQVLTSFNLPQIVVFDRKVRVAGTVQRVIPDTKVFLLPTPVDPNSPDGTDLGGTWWGQTLESMEPDYGVAAGEQPGVVVGAFKTKDPIGVWVHGSAIGLPVLANANLSLAATVL